MILMLLAMFSPVIGIPVFWILPFTKALTVYFFLLVLFTGTMWAMHDAMKRPPMTGAESLVGQTASVLSRSTLAYGPPYVVGVFGELWSAYCRDSLHPGDTVIIVSVHGNSVEVEPKGLRDAIAGPRL
jgi:membrane protein implicated in regulation of membrane protease activity